jgi:SagB-type dehydrogenase family enzyme
VFIRTLNDEGGLPAEFGGAAEAFQTATRNLSFTKRYSKAHETHYEPWIQKMVANAPLHMERGPRVALPPPDPDLLQMPLHEAISRRHSGRTYAATPIPATQLATLLYSVIGVRDRQTTGSPTHSRNVTNSGNLGSVEIYPIIMAATDITPGIYHFDSVSHDLALLKSGHFAAWLREVVLFQIEFADAAVALVLTSAVGRLTAKYGPRGYRFAMIDVGHVSQNTYLVATALGLQVCATAGFVDEALNSALSIDGLDTCASLLLLLGQPPGGPPTHTPTPGGLAE